MKVLYIGDNRINTIVDTVKKRYTSLDALSARSINELDYIVNRGDSIDRAIILDNVLTTMCDIANGQKVRESIQKIIAMVRAGNVNEIVCIAQSDTTGSIFLEELYEIMYSSAVYVVGKQLQVTDMMAYSVQSMSQLRQTSKKTIDTDIYQTDDSVIWSDDKATTSDWVQLGRPSFNSEEFKDKFRLNIALEILDFLLKTATWEYKADLLKNDAQDMIIASKAEAQQEKKESFFSKVFGRKK